jgi:microcystin-dependent protein
MKKIVKLIKYFMIMLLVVIVGSAINAESPTHGLKIQANTLYFGEEGRTLSTEWLKVDIIDSNTKKSLFSETFLNYVIEDGWINLEIGLDPNNILDPKMLSSQTTLVRVSFRDTYGMPEPVIITLNSLANSLFSFYASETVTGNLFPSFNKIQSSFLQVNEDSTQFQYMTTENFLEFINLENPTQINDFLDLNAFKEDQLLIVKNNAYDYMSPELLFETLKLDDFFVDSIIPDISQFPEYAYLKKSNSGNGISFSQIEETYTEVETIATSGIFIGVGSEETPVFIWNNLKNAFETSSALELGYIQSDLLLTQEISLNRLLRVSADLMIEALISSSDENLQAKIDSERDTRVSEDKLIQNTIISADNSLQALIDSNKLERVSQDLLINVLINELINFFSEKDQDIISEIASLNLEIQSADQSVSADIISNEISNQQQIESIISSLNSLNQRYQDSDESLRSAIEVFNSSSDSEELALRVSVNSLFEYYQLKDTEIRSRIIQEKQTNSFYESMLQVSLNAISILIDAEDEAIRQLINQEKLNSDQLEQVLQVSINAIEAAYKIADKLILDRITQNQQLAIDNRITLNQKIDNLSSAYVSSDIKLRNDFDLALFGAVSDTGSDTESIVTQYLAADELIRARITQNRRENISAIEALRISINIFEDIYKSADSNLINSITQNKELDTTAKDELNASINQLTAIFPVVDDSIMAKITANKHLSDEAELAILVSSNLFKQAYIPADSVIQASVNQYELDSDLIDQEIVISINDFIRLYSEADAIIQEEINGFEEQSDLLEEELRSSVNSFELLFEAKDLALHSTINAYIELSTRLEAEAVTSINSINTLYQEEDIRIQSIFDNDVSSNNQKEDIVSSDIAFLQTNLASANTLMIDESIALMEKVSANKNENDTVQLGLIASYNRMLSSSSEKDIELLDLIEAYQLTSTLVQDELITSVSAINSEFSREDLFINQEIEYYRGVRDRDQEELRTSINQLNASISAGDSLLRQSIANIEIDIDSDVSEVSNLLNSVESTYLSEDTRLNDKFYITYQQITNLDTGYSDSDQSNKDFYLANKELIDSKDQSIIASINYANEDYLIKDNELIEILNSLDLRLNSDILSFGDSGYFVNLGGYYDDTILSQAEIKTYIESDSLTFQTDKVIRIDKVTARDTNGLHIGSSSNSGMFISNSNLVGVGIDSPTAVLEVSGNLQANKFFGNGSHLTNIKIPENSINYTHITDGSVYDYHIQSIAWSSLDDIPEYVSDGDDDTLYTNFVGATYISDGVEGLVPKPLIADRDKFLQANGQWGVPTHPHPFSLSTHGHNYWTSVNDTWHQSPDGKKRYYLESNGQTIFRSGTDTTTTFSWLNSSDQEKVRINNYGHIWTQDYGLLQESFELKNHSHVHSHPEKADVTHTHYSDPQDSSLFLNGAGNWVKPVGTHSHPYSLTSHTHNYIQSTVNSWQSSTDSRSRVYFANNSTTYYRSGHNADDLFSWQNESGIEKLKINASGQLWSPYFNWLHDYFAISSHSHSQYSLSSHTHPNPTYFSESGGGGSDKYLNANGSWSTRDSNSILPAGAIILWEGTTPPEGWALCDGTNGTPDLKGRFVMGSSNVNNYEYGGNDTVSITEANIPAHNHSVVLNNQNSSHAHTGTTNSSNASHSGHSITSDGNHAHWIYTYQDDWNEYGGDTGKPSWANDSTNDWNNSHSTSSSSHNHSTNNNNMTHNHSLYSGNNNNNHSHSTSLNSNGSSITFDNRPPYYVLAYIMKL